MQVTDEHRQRAVTLVEPQHELNSPRETILTSTAAAGYLAAVERIEQHDDGGYYASGTGGVDRNGNAWTTSGLSRPTEMRDQAFELLVLADLAEAATPEGTDER